MHPKFYFFTLILVFFHHISQTIADVPPLVDGIGSTLECYKCHSNNPGCGEQVNWLLQRRYLCKGFQPKCIKIIDRESYGTEQYVRGCLDELEPIRPDMPSVRENGCWTTDYKFIGPRGNDQIIHTSKNVYCFCDERDGCNGAEAVSYSHRMLLVVAISTMLLQHFFRH